MSNFIVFNTKFRVGEAPPLLHACEKGNAEIVGELIKKEVELNAVDWYFNFFI